MKYIFSGFLFLQDFDNDGWPDLFVVGDFGRSKLFWNNKDGTFTECTRDCGINEHDVRKLSLFHRTNGLSLATISNKMYKRF